MAAMFVGCSIFWEVEAQNGFQHQRDMKLLAEILNGKLSSNEGVIYCIWHYLIFSKLILF